jgi:hypothetical protein
VELTEKLIDFNDDYPVAKMLSDSVAYINMGALSNNGVDSTFDAFQKTKALFLTCVITRRHGLDDCTPAHKCVKASSFI